MAKRYIGRRDGTDRAYVLVDRDCEIGPLEPRLDLVNHSATGFEWGYSGSGPAQLALAILADALGDDARALRLHQAFKHHVIARLPMAGWQLHDVSVDRIVAAIEEQDRKQECAP